MRNSTQQMSSTAHPRRVRNIIHLQAPLYQTFTPLGQII